MSNFVSGDWTQMRYDHPNSAIGSGVISLKSAEDGVLSTGGRRTEDNDDSVTSSGENIRTIMYKRWSFECMAAWSLLTGEELETLSQMAGDPLEAEWSFTHVSGVTYVGRGCPVGDLKGSGKDATIPFKIAGGEQARKT